MAEPDIIERIAALKAGGSDAVPVILALCEDANACASDALDALTENRLDDARFNLKALLDLVREAIGIIEAR